MSSSETEQSRAERIVAAMMARDAFSQWLGISVLEVRPRYAAVRMVVRDEMVNGFGVTHGGIAYSVADSALAFASNTLGWVTVSIENAITYPVPVRTGDALTAVAEEETASNRLGFYRVTVRRHDDTIVGLFRGTVYRTNTEHVPRAGAGSEREV